MQPPKLTDEYSHGQMMGMLVMIQLMEDAWENDTEVSESLLETVKGIAVNDLSHYLCKPEEDVLLLVNEQLRKI